MAKFDSPDRRARREEIKRRHPPMIEAELAGPESATRRAVEADICLGLLQMLGLADEDGVDLGAIDAMNAATRGIKKRAGGRKRKTARRAPPTPNVVDFTAAWRHHFIAQAADESERELRARVLAVFDGAGANGGNFEAALDDALRDIDAAIAVLEARRAIAVGTVIEILIGCDGKDQRRAIEAVFRRRAKRSGPGCAGDRHARHLEPAAQQEEDDED